MCGGSLVSRQGVQECALSPAVRVGDALPGVGGSFQRTALSVLAARWYLREWLVPVWGRFL